MQVNSQQRYIAELDGLFRTMVTDNTLLGWAARRLMLHYVRKNAPPSIAGIRAIDIPPVLPNTLEIVTDDEGDSSLPIATKSHHPRRAIPSQRRRSISPSTGE